jgi:hypothetical protein
MTGRSRSLRTTLRHYTPPLEKAGVEFLDKNGGPRRVA